jgi:hypothetical protein
MADELYNPGVRFEPSDAKAGWIFSIIAGTLAFGAVVLLGVHFFFVGYRDHLAEERRSHFPLAPAPSLAFPKKPHLEQIDRLAGDKNASVYQREADKLKTLNSYGQTNAKGFVHIPIEQAMKLAVEKKMLQARPAIPEAERRRAGGLVDAGESNSGRLFKGGAK